MMVVGFWSRGECSCFFEMVHYILSYRKCPFCFGSLFKYTGIDERIHHLSLTKFLGGGWKS